jgi:hypothetical protein
VGPVQGLVEGQKELVCNGTKGTKGVNNEGNKEGIALNECSNNHFTIHKSTDIIDSRATSLLRSCASMRSAHGYLPL